MARAYIQLMDIFVKKVAVKKCIAAPSSPRLMCQGGGGGQVGEGEKGEGGRQAKSGEEEGGLSCTYLTPSSSLSPLPFSSFSPNSYPHSLTIIFDVVRDENSI